MEYKYLITRHRDGLTRYFFNNGGKPRKDIPLGGDFEVAVKKWKTLVKKRVGYVALEDKPKLSKLDVVPLGESPAKEIVVLVANFKPTRIDALPKYYINFKPKQNVITPFNLKQWNADKVSILNSKHPNYSR